MGAKVERHPVDAPQVKPLCVEFIVGVTKRGRDYLPEKGKTGGYGKESRIKAYAGHPPAHANSQRPATPFALFQGVTFWSNYKALAPIFKNDADSLRATTFPLGSNH